MRKIIIFTASIVLVIVALPACSDISNHDDVDLPSKELTDKAPAPDDNKTQMGRWCYLDIPTNAKYDSLIEILKSDGGSIVVHTQYRGGSESTKALTERNGALLKNNKFGEFYIISANGSLELHDSDGLIGVAKTVSAKTDIEDCRN